MANGFQVSTYVDAPVDVVWGRLSDLERASDWMNGIDNMQIVGGASLGDGSKIAFQARGAMRESIVSGWSPPNCLELTSRQGGMAATYKYNCQPRGSGTQLSLTAACVADGLAWRLLSPLIGFLMKRADSGQIDTLKRIVEAGSESS